MTPDELERLLGHALRREAERVEPDRRAFGVLQGRILRELGGRNDQGLGAAQAEPGGAIDPDDGAGAEPGRAS